jgi:hypothetical protein
MSQFWLKVKESYIIENFNELAKYLSNYTAPSNAQIDEDFEATYTCLQKVAHEQCDKAFSQTNLYEKFRSDGDLDLISLVHLVLASILTSHNIKHEEDYTLLIHLANIILLNKRNLSAESCRDLLEFIQMCMEQRSIKRFTLSWRNIDNSIDVIAEHLLYTEWESVSDTEAASTTFYEHNGMAFVKDGVISLIAQNLKNYKLNKNSVPTVMSLQCGLKVQSRTTAKLKATASPLDAIAKTNELYREFSQIAPSLTKLKSDYSEGAIAPVVVVKKYYNEIIVKTIDPAYNEVRCKLQVENFSLAKSTLIDRGDLLRSIELGDVLLATYHTYNLGFFTIDYHVYKDFYAEESLAVCDEKQEATAVFIADYPQGSRWLDENGLLINIYNGILSDEDRDTISFAKESHCPILVRHKDVADMVVVNGTVVRCLEDEIIDRLSFSKRAQKNLINDFLAYCQSLAEDLPKTAEYVALPGPFGLIVAARALYRLSGMQDTTLERVKTLSAAIILDKICGDSAANDMEFMRHELKFLECGIKFVRGENPGNLQLTHVDCLDGVPKVMLNEHVVQVLSGYKQDDGLSDTRNIAANMAAADSIDIENIGKLVEASNILRGKIQDKSLARIKAEIAAKLELDDEYIPESVDNESTYYGVESDTLEFKSSIVFPPCNRQTGRGTANPDNQRWVIIKTICGFLNSHSGGELYLGVRDNGYACGLKDDIDKLYELDRIHSRSMDGYRNYVKCLVDPAFISFDKQYRGTDITFDTIKYSIMTNNEGLDILRVRVEPFKYDAVRIADVARNKPEWVADAYVRTSGATIPLTDFARQQISDKRHLNK